ncbi:MAG TPA: NfeD family protein [Anaeromyxobacter sp.]|nr:NfeD family protein [Anaeromyxobacter sp.]
MSWWLWVLLGLLLLAMEMLTPGGLFALFFGAGALCVAVVAALGAGPVVQWITFTVLSLLLLATLRSRLKGQLRTRAVAPVDALEGQEVVLLGDLPAGGVSQAELRGAPWTARAASGIPLCKGQRCRVERVEGLVLYVTALSREERSA